MSSLPVILDTNPGKPVPLTDDTLAEGVRFLVQRDKDLAQVVGRYGAPPMWGRPPGFPTLIHIILEQQVSLASARAAFDRLIAAVSPLTPAGFLTLDDTQLKTIGFSRQKTRYGRLLAEAITQGHLDLDELATRDDATVRDSLMQLKGIGRWSADIYLLMALRRPDIWPRGDLALEVAAQRVKGLAGRPTPDQLEAMAERWRPWRAVAARILWYYYLDGRD